MQVSPIVHVVPSLAAPQHVRTSVCVIPSLLRLTIVNGASL